MGKLKQNIQSRPYLVFFIVIAFLLLYSAYTPLSNIGNRNFLCIACSSNFSGEAYEYLLPVKSKYDFISDTADEILSTVKPAQIKGRYIQVLIKLLFAFSNMQKSLSAHALSLIYTFIFLAGEMGKYVSIIALSVGGHSPPTV